MKPRRHPKFGSGEIIILILIGLLVLIVVTGNLKSILDRIFGVTTALVVVVMLVEYLILKGSDRSAIYRRELEVTRLRRRDDLLALRDLETQLDDLREHMALVLEREADTPGLREAIETSHRISVNLLGRLRERI